MTRDAFDSDRPHKERMFLSRYVIMVLKVVCYFVSVRFIDLCALPFVQQLPIAVIYVLSDKFKRA